MRIRAEYRCSNCNSGHVEDVSIENSKIHDLTCHNYPDCDGKLTKKSSRKYIL